MKFINREYGINGRPPFFKEYAAVSEKGPTIGEGAYLTRSLVGFGMEPGVPNGAIIAGEFGSIWALRFAYQNHTKWIESEDFIEEPERFLAGDTEGKFRYICHGDLTVSMVKYSKNALVMSLAALDKVKIRVTFACLAGSEVTARISGGHMQGFCTERAVIRGEQTLSDDGIIAVGRYEALFGESEGHKEHAVAAVLCGGESGTYDVNGNEITYEVTLDSSNSRLVVYMAVGGEEIEADIPTLEELNRGVNHAELSYSAEKTVGKGALAEHASEIVSKSASHKIFNQLRLATHYVEDRKTVDKHYSFEPTAASAGALVAALIDDAQLDQTVAYGDEPVAGALAVWVAFCRTRNRELLAKTYPKWQKKWIADAKLLTVDPLTKREIAYKMPESPLKEVKAEPLYSLEFNSYKMLALDIMEKSARILGKGEDARLYADALAAFRARFNEALFNKRLGIYMDRYQTGEFARAFGVSSFLPLIAGAVTDNDTLDALLVNLTDPEKFWNEAPVPTISVDNSAYGKRIRRRDGTFRAPFEDFTGSSIALLNYLVYLGLIRVGAADASSRLAQKLSAVWTAYYTQYRAVPNILLPNRKQDERAVADSLTGNLVGLAGLSDLIDVEYFREDLRPSVRFGTLVPGDHRLNNVRIFNRKLSLSKVDNITTFWVDGVKAIEGVGGTFLVRNLVENPDGLEFMVYARDSVTFSLTAPIFNVGKVPSANYRFNLDAGKFLVKISNRRFSAERL